MTESSDDTADADEIEAAAETAEQAAETAKQAKSGAEDARDEAETQADRAEDAVELLAPADDPVIDPEIREAEAGVDDDNPYGVPGRKISRRSPFIIGFSGGLGVLAAFVVGLTIADTRQVLVLILVAAFVAVGLDPLVTWLTHHGLSRGQAVLAVVVIALLALAGFIAAIAPPIAHQSTDLVHNAPSYLDRLDKNATIARFDHRYHIVEKVQARAKKGLSITALGGVFGVGKAILSAVGELFTVVILTIYFLANLPGIKRIVYRAVPRSRRARVGLLADEMLARVGGYVLGNLATSVVAGTTCFVWLLAWGVPFPIALALFIAVTDLIPLVGATIGAVGVSAVALFHGVVPGIATIVFFIVYQQFENYILQPRVMRRTVDVAPLLTILAALLGGALLGILGALIAVPFAAAIQLLVTEVLYPRQDEA
ncbi:MAG TPA: AI-2E family transporter [Mycobacteriales bacterium]|nr:AI-2E family transporter [Mycobacteriales bacterium]